MNENMNMDLLQRLYDWLSQGGEVVYEDDTEELLRFDMSVGIEKGPKGENFNDCGTACCIAGAAVILSEGVPDCWWSWLSIKLKAIEYLEIDKDTADNLFYPEVQVYSDDGEVVDLIKVATPDMAATAVGILMNTREFHEEDWIDIVEAHGYEVANV